VVGWEGEGWEKVAAVARGSDPRATVTKARRRMRMRSEGRAVWFMLSR
jgi:hypothetical protein